MNTVTTLFVPDLQPALKHPTVFNRFDALQPGESFLLVNDHDPIPLFYEMKAERGEGFEWKKIENGPEVWKVEIKKTGKSSQAANVLKEVNQDPANAIFDLNVTVIEPRLKHPTIFKYFDADAIPSAAEMEVDEWPTPNVSYSLSLRLGNPDNPL